MRAITFSLPTASIPFREIDILNDSIQLFLKSLSMKGTAYSAVRLRSEVER